MNAARASVASQRARVIAPLREIMIASSTARRPSSSPFASVTTASSPASTAPSRPCNTASKSSVGVEPARGGLGEGRGGVLLHAPPGGAPVTTHHLADVADAQPQQQQQQQAAETPPPSSSSSSVSHDDANGGDSEEDERPILISSVDFDGETPELEQLARSVVFIKPNFSYTKREIQTDLQRIFDTGKFSTVAPMTVDTRDGVALTFKLVANPVVRGFIVKGCDEYPTRLLHQAFKPQFGKVMNTNVLEKEVTKIRDWYEARKIPAEWYSVVINPDGLLEIAITEPRIGEVQIRFLDRKTGEPVVGSTRPEMITRHLKSVKPGKVLHARMVEDLQDLIATAGLETATITWAPRRDETDGQLHLVDTIINVVEKQSAGFSGGGGITAKGLQQGGLNALVANADFFRRNLFGRCQTLTARLEVSPSVTGGGRAEVDLKVTHTDPWVGDANRTSRRTYLDTETNTLEHIHGKTEPALGDDDGDGAGGAADLASDDGPKGVFARRNVAGVEYRRPLAASWTGTFAATYQRASTHDESKRECLHDAYGSPLTFSGHDVDTSFSAMTRFVYEGRGRDEAQLVLTAEQALPIRPDMLSFNRVLVRAQRNFHVAGTRFFVAAKGGNVIGDLPPYDAFSIGGANSVRGYPEGGVGTGRKFIVGSAELSVPLATDTLNGYAFFDVGSDLKSGASVLGDPGGTRGKPGQGYGYGLGVSAASPVGPLRLEYAFSDKGVGRMHCGIGRNF